MKDNLLTGNVNDGKPADEKMTAGRFVNDNDNETAGSEVKSTGKSTVRVLLCEFSLPRNLFRLLER